MAPLFLRRYHADGCAPCAAALAKAKNVRKWVLPVAVASVAVAGPHLGILQRASVLAVALACRYAATRITGAIGGEEDTPRRSEAAAAP